MAPDNYSEKRSISSLGGSATPAVVDSDAPRFQFISLSQGLDRLREILSRSDGELGSLREELCGWESNFRAKLDEAAEQQARLRDEIMRWQIATADADTKALQAQRKLEAAIARQTPGGELQPKSAPGKTELAGEPKPDKSSGGAEARLNKLQTALREFYVAVVNPMTVAVASAQLLSAGDQEVLTEIQESLNQMLQGFRKFAARMSDLGVVFEEDTPGQQDDSSQEY